MTTTLRPWNAAVTPVESLPAFKQTTRESQAAYVMPLQVPAPGNACQIGTATNWPFLTVISVAP